MSDDNDDVFADDDNDDNEVVTVCTGHESIDCNCK